MRNVVDLSKRGKPTSIALGNIELMGELVTPKNYRSALVLARTPWDGWRRRDYQTIAAAVRQENVATLLVDLTTKEESETPNARQIFESRMSMLAKRLRGVCGWLGNQLNIAEADMSLFGARTGAGVALVGGAGLKAPLSVISCSGRTDLAQPYLEHILCPTLLIVKDDDRALLEWNVAARGWMGSNVEFEMIDGGSFVAHPKGIDAVARLTRQWIREHHHFGTRLTPRNPVLTATGIA